MIFDYEKRVKRPKRRLVLGTNGGSGGAALSPRNLAARERMVWGAAS